MCDIERMFHRFRVRDDHQDYIRFLWWEGGNLETEPVSYRLKVHLFGAVSSPGCAIYGLRHMAEKFKDLSPEASAFIAENFYMDDGLGSTDEVEEAIKVIKGARSICQKGNVRLHKLASNSREVLESIPPSERAKDIMELDLSLDDLPIERALGIQWCIESDVFQFRLTIQDQPLTRRGILSMVSSVFDPLGFLAPFLLTGKQILQHLCRESTDWDQPLPNELRPKWEGWRRGLVSLATIKIPRCFKPTDFGPIKQMELHHFSDASLTGYGQCSYLRLVDEIERVHCSLAMSKARVAPLKPVTVPRLELQAAVVSVKISDFLNKELKIKEMKNYYWTDSRVVLGYIQNEARRFKIFVANRVQRIRESSEPGQWRHIATDINPADHASRGLEAEELETSRWFNGPAFLWEKQLPEVSDSTPDHDEISNDDPEVKKVTALATKATERTAMLKRFEKFSDWSRLLSAISTLRERCLRKLGKGIPDLTEIRRASETFIILCIQREAFADEIDELQRGEHLKKGNQLYNLDPFPDEDGILRVGGRLKHSNLNYRAKHPAIIPKKTAVAELLIKHHHEKTAHQGRGMTMNELRARGFWIPGCSAQVSSHIFKCVVCRRFRGTTQVQKMADLPKDRLDASPPFTYCGIDVFGPFEVTERRKTIKRYGLLFTCMASRAIHIELLDDMTTDVFLNALRCFVALRGKVRLIRCDRGSNFVGARQELKEAMKEIDDATIQAHFQGDCEFVMNSPESSHKGGVWERQIRTIRSVLRVVLGLSHSRLDTSSLRTLFYEVMAIINSRPLTVENLNDPTAPLPLTPNQLLTMKSDILMPPPGEFPKEDLYARKRWRRVQYLANEFWQRWRKEYLQNLQQRQKWQKQRRNVEVGDIVILNDADLPRCDWKLAMVETTEKGRDDLTRTVKLRMASAELTADGKRKGKVRFLERPIHKLIMLLEKSPDQPD
ncbi:uncharacterized protein LOC135489117 [Lineus longissimus]|uniref:uncharacterized protein LOC135489117 n=1 Tax=Lineus longissimus TaxID=88925 RepID=UPI00315CBA70